MSGLKGMAEFKANLEAAMDRYKRALAAGVYGEASNIVADSVTAAPIDTGSLRRSHYVTEPAINKGNVSVEFGCGGVATPYALRQHEEHKTKSKFLQNAMNLAKADALQNVSAIARAAFESNSTTPKQHSTEVGPIPKTPDGG